MVLVHCHANNEREISIPHEPLPSAVLKIFGIGFAAISDSFGLTMGSFAPLCLA